MLVNTLSFEDRNDLICRCAPAAVCHALFISLGDSDSMATCKCWEGTTIVHANAGLVDDLHHYVQFDCSGAEIYSGNSKPVECMRLSQYLGSWADWTGK